ncbi:MAG: DUF6183 family protein [Myxococcota bacterium]
MEVSQAADRLMNASAAFDEGRQAVVERRTAADSGWLAALADELERREASPVARNAVLVSLASCPGRDMVRLVLERWPTTSAPHIEEDPSLPLASARTLAAVLAQTQKPPTLEAEAPRLLMGTAFERDLAACWVQEAVLRGQPVGTPPLRRGWSMLEGHLLHALPLVLESLEARLPGFAPKTDGFHRSGAGGLAMVTTAPVAGRTRVMPAEDITTPTRASQIASVGAHARAFHGARIEARVVELADPLQPDSLDADLVRGLRLACTGPLRLDDAMARPLTPAAAGRRHRSKAQVAVVRREPAIVFETLMNLATHGGHTNLVWSAACGRLLARRSLSGLVGLGQTHAWSEVVEAAQRCVLWQARIDSGWFFGVGADDLLLLVLGEDRRTLSVLGYTDTD